MDNKNLEDMLVKLHREARPGKWFAWKLKMRLRQKARAMSLQQAFAGKGAFRFATALALVVLTLGSGIGTYAYASPDVTVDHPLYPVKQGLESAELYFAADAETRARVHLKHALRRMAEMETLSSELRRSNQPEAQRRAEQTLLLLQNQMNESLVVATEEDEVDSAKKVVDALQENLEEVDEHLGLLEQREHLKSEKKIHDRLGKMRDFTKLKLRRVEEVSNQIRSPMRIKGPRVILKRLTEDDLGLETAVDVRTENETSLSDGDSSAEASGETALFIQSDSNVESSGEEVKESDSAETEGTETENGVETGESNVLNFDLEDPEHTESSADSEVEVRVTDESDLEESLRTTLYTR